VNLDVGVEKEACPLDLAPTSSTTAALVMGDALAIALLDARGFTAEDFARSHPGGSWAGACCCSSTTSCTPATPSPGCGRTPRCATPCWR
jgi:hypothetical protein